MRRVVVACALSLKTLSAHWLLDLQADFGCTGGQRCDACKAAYHGEQLFSCKRKNLRITGKGAEM